MTRLPFHPYNKQLYQVAIQTNAFANSIVICNERDADIKHEKDY